MYRQRGGKTRRADRHRVEQRQALRQRHHPVGGDAHIFGKPAIVIHPHAVAGHQHRIARIETRIG